MLPVIARLLSKGVMAAATVELTNRCPLNCRHCYLGGKVTEELSGPELVDLMDQLVDMGTISLCFTGGEVFLRKDLEDLVREALHRGFLLTLKTSCFGSSPELWRRLVALGLRHVDISFYGANAETHDSFTRRPGSFKVALESALLLQDLGVWVKGVYTPSRVTEPSAQRLRQQLLALGLKILIMNQLDEISCDGYPLEDLTLTREQYLDQVDFQVGPFQGRDDALALDSRICAAGWSSAFILANGDVQPCHRIERVIGNIRRTPLTEIWASDPTLQRLRSLRRRDLAACNGCKNIRFCNYCLGAALRDSGDFVKPSPATCAQGDAWRLSAEARAKGLRDDPER